MAQDVLTITDNRVNRTYTMPIETGTIRAMVLRQIKTYPDDFGLMSYDPAVMNTASCRSNITFLDGERGILRYRGYPIEALAEKCTFLEVAYLLISGNLPTEQQLKDWVYGRGNHENGTGARTNPFRWRSLAGLARTRRAGGLFPLAFSSGPAGPHGNASRSNRWFRRAA